MVLMATTARIIYDWPLTPGTPCAPVAEVAMLAFNLNRLGKPQFLTQTRKYGVSLASARLQVFHPDRSI